MTSPPQRPFNGLDLRLRRLLGPDGRALVIPLDHAITTGPTGGLQDPRAVVAAAVEGGADAVMLRPGLARALDTPGAERLAVIMALTGRLARGVDHVALNSVEHALAQGADAVCGEFKFGSDGDLPNVALVSALAETAHRYGLPVLITVYTLPGILAERGPAAYAHGCRIAEELGADMIKTSLPADDEVLADVVASVGVPVVLAGGDPRSEDELAEYLRGAVRAGAAGAAVGRNAFGSADPAGTIRRLAGLIHERSTEPVAAARA